MVTLLLIKQSKVF